MILERQAKRKARVLHPSTSRGSASHTHHGSDATTAAGTWSVTQLLIPDAPWPRVPPTNPNPGHQPSKANPSSPNPPTFAATAHSGPDPRVVGAVAGADGGEAGGGEMPTEVTSGAAKSARPVLSVEVGGCDDNSEENSPFVQLHRVATARTRSPSPQHAKQGLDTGVGLQSHGGRTGLASVQHGDTVRSALPGTTQRQQGQQGQQQQDDAMGGGVTGQEQASAREWRRYVHTVHSRTHMHTQRQQEDLGENTQEQHQAPVREWKRYVYAMQSRRYTHTHTCIHTHTQAYMQRCVCCSCTSCVVTLSSLTVTLWISIRCFGYCWWTTMGTWEMQCG